MNRLYLTILAALWLIAVAGADHARAGMVYQQADTDTLELPFFDDFSYTSDMPDKGLWKTNGVSINTNLPQNPPSTGVLLLDATDGNKNFYKNARYGSVTDADTIESNPINLLYPGSKSIYLSFFYQCGGLGDAPEEGDSLVLEFYSPTERRWFGIRSYAGGKCRPFRQEMIPIDDNKFLQKGFRFRFRNYISLGSQLAPDLVGNCDHWMVDYVYINKNRYESDTVYSDVSLTNLPEVRIGEYQQVPWMHYTASATKPAVNYLIKYRNNDSKARLLDSINMVLRHNGKTEPYALGTFNMPGSMDFENENMDFRYTFTSESDTSANYDIEVRLVSDGLSSDYPNNNSVTIHKTLDNCYAYDDGTAEAAYGLQGEGASGGLVAVRYTTLKPDRLIGIYMYFSTIYGNRQASIFNLKIWDCENGEPKNAIYSKRNVTVPKDNTEKFILIPVDDEVMVTDTFFVGWEKNENAMIAIGFDKNTTSVNHKYYNIGGKWKQSKEPGQIMMRPAFGYLKTANRDDLGPALSIGHGKINVFPNPASDHITIKTEATPCRILIISASGKPVMEVPLQNEETEIPISGLATGTYIIYSPTTRARAKFLKVR